MKPLSVRQELLSLPLAGQLAPEVMSCRVASWPVLSLVPNESGQIGIAAHFYRLNETADIQPDGFDTPIELEPTDLLRRFARLAEATDLQILEFARLFGRLGECAAPDHPSPGCLTCTQRLPSQDFPDTWESLLRWRITSRVLRGALRIWADLSEGNQPNQLEMRALRLLVPNLEAQPTAEGRSDTFRLRAFVSALLNSENLWLDIVAEETGFSSVLLGSGIRAALSLGLAVAVTSAGWVRCDVCANAYRAPRQPRKSQRKYGPERHYCSADCGTEGERRRQRAAYAAAGRTHRPSA